MGIATIIRERRGEVVAAVALPCLGENGCNCWRRLQAATRGARPQRAQIGGGSHRPPTRHRQDDCLAAPLEMPNEDQLQSAGLYR
jgi:hypothetical protein